MALPRHPARLDRAGGFLPLYSPELNPVERLWGYLPQHDLANRAYEGYQHLLDAGAAAWQQLSPELLRSVCACDDLTRDEGL